MAGIREQQKMQKLQYMTELEREHWEAGQTHIAGIDEAGRGPLAGPVVAACVVMPQDNLILGIDDSKKLTEKKREQLYDEIINTCVGYSVGIVDHTTIDEINILNATRKAFMDALGGITCSVDHLYTDAMPLETECPCTSLIKGDARMYTIAAASIIAKVTRDRIMLEYAKKYPEYRFEAHKGYGTKAHYAAIEQHGVLDIHRRSFLKKVLQKG